MLKKIFFILLTLLFLNSYAQNGYFEVGSKQAGMGNTGVSYCDIWSVNRNQAGLIELKKPTLALNYENRFSLKELGLKSVAFAYPTSSGTFALDFNQFGYNAFTENNIGIAFAKSLGGKFSLGVKFDYFNTKIAENYGNKGAFLAEFGVLAQPINHLFIGGHIYNLNKAKIAMYNNEHLPTFISFGISYEFSEKVLCAVETEKDIEYKSTFKIGMEYKFFDNLFIRAGVENNPNQLSFGIGYSSNKLKADLSFSTHQVLGISSHIGVCYTFGKEYYSNKLN